MPTIPHLVGILVAILVIWIVLKLAQVAIRVIFFVVAILLIVAAVYYVFMR